MNRILPVLLTIFIAANSYSQDTILPHSEVEFIETTPNLVRKYFFENVNFSKEGKELVVIVKKPQTTLAEDFGFRLYSDTLFLNKIESEFYTEIDTLNREIHFCGYDIYFYIKSGRNLKFYNSINSRCGINGIGCENLNYLAEHGTVLNVDTLRVLDFQNLEPKEIIPEDIVYCDYISSDGTWQDYNSSYNNSCAKPYWVYDGKFQATIKVDQITPVNYFIEQFFSHIDSLEFKNIIYRLEREDEEQIHVFKGTSTHLLELRLNIYLDKDCYKYFSNYVIEPNRLDKRKIELKDGYYILIK